MTTPDSFNYLPVVEPAACYAGFVQRCVHHALHGHPGHLPGAYRSVVRIEVDGTGNVSHPRLLGSTGDALRDAQLLTTLRGIRIEPPPPPGWSQPVTMLIAPAAG